MSSYPFVTNLTNDSIQIYFILLLTLRIFNHLAQRQSRLVTYSLNAV